jgi:hypothetical protein
MSTPVVSTPVVSTPKVQKEKKPRAPTLPAKFSKFIHFGFWFLDKINDDPETPAVDRDLFIEKLNLFSQVDQQKDFVQEFFDQAKDVNKNVRLLIKQHSKDIVKAAKDEAKAAKNADKPKKERKPRVKKTKDASPEDAFVNEMVQLANGQDTIPSPIPPATPKVSKKEPKEKVVKEPKEKVVKEKVVKEPKEKVVKEKVVKEPKEKVVKEKVVKEPKEKVVKEKVVKEPKDKVVKEKVVKEPKDKATKANDPDTSVVSILTLNDQQFLIDDNTLDVYDFHNHSLIGKFDPKNKIIISTK